MEVDDDGDAVTGRERIERESYRLIFRDRDVTCRRAPARAFDLLFRGPAGAAMAFPGLFGKIFARPIVMGVRAGF